MTQRADGKFIPALRFHALTPLFDLVAAALARDGSLKSQVIERASIEAGERVLDVGCGTGTLAIAAARAAPGVIAKGLDADPAILARARDKAAASRTEIEFDEALSTSLPYDDSSFDVVLSTLFFHHLADGGKRQTAHELLRVLRPGGRLAVADVGRPHDALMRVAVRATVQLLDGTATTSLNVRGELPAVLGDAGFSEVTVRERMRTPTGSYDIVTATKPEA